MANRSVYRVNYYLDGQSASAFVCASQESEAADFIGVRDGSAQVSRLAGPVEVVGVDQAHDAIAPAPVFKAPPPPPDPVAWEKFDALTQELVKLREQLAAQNALAAKPKN